MATTERTPKSPSLPGAIAAASSEKQYLGDIAVIDGMVRNLFNDALHRRNVQDPKATDADEKDTETLAGILLGKYKEYEPQPAWNRPGGVDQWIREQTQIEEDEPVRVVQTALLQKLVDFYKIVTYSQQPGVLEEQWNWQIDALVADARNLLLGIPELG